MITDDSITPPGANYDMGVDIIPLGQPSQEEQVRLMEHFETVSFEDYYSDVTKVPAIEKSRYFLAACFGVIDNFSLKVEPYCTLSLRQLPTNKMLRQEALRRSNNAKGLRHKKTDEYICALKSEAYQITSQSDISFIIQTERSMREVLLEKTREAKEEAERKKENSQIKNTDRLHFIETILSDDVKALYLKSQDCMTRNELDSRNSVVRVVDFYDKVTEIFNNENVSAVTTVLHDLHEDFAQPIDCPILD